MSTGGIDKSFAKQVPTDDVSEDTVFQRLSLLEETSKILVTSPMSRRQLELLTLLKENEGLLYYQVVTRISDAQDIPASTVRWNLNKLRDAKLIIAGDRNKKGVPVQLTDPGKLIANLFEESQPEMPESDRRWDQQH